MTTKVEEDAADIYERVIADYKKMLSESNKAVSFCIKELDRHKEIFRELEERIALLTEGVELRDELIALYRGEGTPEQIKGIFDEIERRQPIGVR